MPKKRARIAMIVLLFIFGCTRCFLKDYKIGEARPPFIAEESCAKPKVEKILFWFFGPIFTILKFLYQIIQPLFFIVLKPNKKFLFRKFRIPEVTLRNYFVKNVTKRVSNF